MCWIKCASFSWFFFFLSFLSRRPVHRLWFLSSTPDCVCARAHRFFSLFLITRRQSDSTGDCKKVNFEVNRKWSFHRTTGWKSLTIIHLKYVPRNFILRQKLDSHRRRMPRQNQARWRMSFDEGRLNCHPVVATTLSSQWPFAVQLLNACEDAQTNASNEMVETSLKKLDSRCGSLLGCVLCASFSIEMRISILEIEMFVGRMTIDNGDMRRKVDRKTLSQQNKRWGPQQVDNRRENKHTFPKHASQRMWVWFQWKQSF